MAADVGRDERAARHDAQAAGPHVVESAFRKTAADPASLELGQDHGVDEDDPVAAQPVLREADELAVEQSFVPAGVGCVDDTEPVAGCLLPSQV